MLQMRRQAAASQDGQDQLPPMLSFSHAPVTVAKRSGRNFSFYLLLWPRGFDPCGRHNLMVREQVNGQNIMMGKKTQIIHV